MKFNMIRVHINAQGYDNNGQYWGTGNPLYVASNEEHQCVIRARDRKHAKEVIRGEYPQATFFN